MSLPLLLAIVAAIAGAQPSDPPGIEITLCEPLDRDWSPAWVSFPVELPKGRLKPRPAADKPGRDKHYLLVHETHDDGSVKRATAYSWTGLKAGQRKVLHFGPDDAVEPGTMLIPLGVRMAGLPVKAIFQTEGFYVCLPVPESSKGEFLPTSGRRVFPDGLASEEVAAPIMAIGPTKAGPTQRMWQGKLEGLGQIAGMTITRDLSIPHQYGQTVSYELVDGGTYTVKLTLVAHEPIVLIEESFEGIRRGGLRLSPAEPAHRWQPTHEHGRGRLGPPGEGELTTGYEIDFSTKWTGRIQPFYAWWHDYGLWWACYRPGGDYIGILPLEPSKWMNPPPNPIQIHTGPGHKVEVFFPFDRGTRKWALVAGDADEALKVSKGGANLMMRMAIRHGQNPLDKVKDMALTWDGMENIENPRLLCTKADIPRIQRKAQTHALFKRVLDNYPDQPDDPAGLYLATGQKDYARQAIDALIAQLRQWVEDALDGGNYGESFCAIGWTRPVRNHALIYDIVASVMTREQRNYCLRAFAFLNYCLYDENRWPARNQGFSRGNINFHSDDYTARAVVSCLLKDHPLQKKWMAFVEREMTFEFDSSVFPGGAWCEAPNYQGFTMHYLMIAMRAMQLNGFADFAKDPRFRATMDYFFRIQTPLDVRAGIHLLPTVGDTTSCFHSQSLQNTFSWAATLFQDDPKLSGLMMHAWRRAGSIVFAAHSLGAGKGWIHPLTFTDPELPAIGPPEPLRSERLPGYGAIFRNHYGTDRESYFLFKMGPSDQHYDSDEGSFHWYALGKPVSLDFGSMYKPVIVQPWLHSTIHLAKDNVRYRKWTRGEVTRFVSLPDLDFCTGQMAINDIQAVPDLPREPWPQGVSRLIERHKRFVDWRRELLFVRYGDYVVMRDSLDDAQDAFTTGWTTQVLATDASVVGPRAHFNGQHGIGLGVFVAEPDKAELTTTTWGHPGQGNWETDWEWMMENPMPPMGESQIALHTSAPIDGDYLVAMVPTEYRTTPPKMTSPAKDVIRITEKGHDETVFFAPDHRVIQTDDILFAGRVGLVRREKDIETVHIIEGVSMRTPRMIAQFPGPVSLKIQPGRLTGTCDGQARTCFLHWTDPPPTPAKLTIDGEPTYAYSTFDGYLRFTVPKGRHQFEVTYDMSRK